MMVRLRKAESEAEQDIAKQEIALEHLMQDKGCADAGVVAACIKLCDNLNKEALKTLHAEQPEDALVLLRKAELLAANTSLPSETPAPIVAVTYNNIACCLKRTGKLRTALQVNARSCQCSSGLRQQGASCQTVCVDFLSTPFNTPAVTSTVPGKSSRRGRPVRSNGS